MHLEHCDKASTGFTRLPKGSWAQKGSGFLTQNAPLRPSARLPALVPHVQRDTEERTKGLAPHFLSLYKYQDLLSCSVFTGFREDDYIVHILKRKKLKLTQ